MQYADFDNRDQYDSWVRSVARNNIERDGSNPRFVAEVCIYDVQDLEGEVALLTVADPYSNTRASATSVITVHSNEERARHRTRDMGYRDLAVELLASDIAEAMEKVVGKP